jgi:hypothetical protein
LNLRDEEGRIRIPDYVWVKIWAANDQTHWYGLPWLEYYRL